MYDPDVFTKLYPEWFQKTSAIDIITTIFIFSLVFIIPYIYIKFIEEKLILKLNTWSVIWFCQREQKQDEEKSE